MSVILADGDLSIRHFQDSDIDDVYEAVIESKGALMPFLFWCHAGYSRDETRTFIEAQLNRDKMAHEYNFAITDTLSGAFLGGIGLSHISYINRVASLGYWVRTSASRRGVATRAAKLIARYGFREFGLYRIELIIQTDNPASMHVAGNLGALREGELRNRIYVNGKSRNAYCYSLVPKDCERWDL